ncbi:MAG: hypothetical protein KBB01_01650 [Candidatus Omnitrophica bacterium]|jgi:formate hydrogenlyase subunit 3/multisubunit Na+/H+ antiporter MnhD subunit|nr:hypothetical protein [Candidatus Omnitrophota bacterium]
MNISLFFSIFTWILGIAILLYSYFFLKGRKRYLEFFLYGLLTLIIATKAFKTDDFLIFLIFWGVLLILLYAMLSIGSFKTASRALAILGIADFCLIIGIIFLISITKTTSMNISPVSTDNLFSIVTFMLIAIGAIAKAGVFGFHNWIIESAETNPSVTMAFFPACLDKFIGIYLFLRVFKDFFIVSDLLKIIFMGIGALTILFAVLLALIQHDMKKLLAYHAVSQVGYMVLGIASGTLLGMVGGLFHMLNNTIYKSSLFLNSGNIEYTIGKTDLNEIGGLAKYMPVTFLATVIASFSISGIPPFNGFFSKWIIYQSLITNGSVSFLAICKMVFLVIALFGSALTLASFLKIIYSAFLNTPPKENIKKIKEVPFIMQLPILFMSILCIGFGIFANNLVIKPFLAPLFDETLVPSGFWASTVATVLMVLGIALGFGFYFLSRLPVRKNNIFIGGEELADSRVSGTDFYLTLKETQPLRLFYNSSDKGVFDFYTGITTFLKVISYIFYYSIDRIINFTTNAVGKSVFGASILLKKLHNGLLDRYVTWLILGLVLVIGVLYRCLSCI